MFDCVHVTDKNKLKNKQEGEPCLIIMFMSLIKSQRQVMFDCIRVTDRKTRRRTMFVFMSLIEKQEGEPCLCSCH